MLEVEHLIVALVEPSHVQAQIIKAALAERGIDQVTVYETGADLFTALAVKLPDLVFSALYLSDMTGTDLVYTLRDTPAWADLPFILISSETNPYYLDPVRQAGTMAILPKPFSQAQLTMALGNTLDFLNAEQLDNDSADDFADLVVLLVDDSSTARRHVRTILEKIGFEKIFEANNGLEAIPLINSQLFDLVFTDYNMPQMDGRALVEYIRKESMQSSVPILMVSSEDNQGRLAAVEAAGVSAICDKPFGTEVVRKLVGQLLANRE
ncbi:response regulator [Paludibacterium purpuratum]|uniref:Two-component system chemotaxis response regulator CheY n=1 Tax=Paludibacterium purpuratum TaxID=1144873 RepID=A0A4R7B632_9NEIS|nr:response regulator [Paludibacterium purpuratum]TDR79893.1 two-component system chemotaxis response regulator CheY [Paludibacterium purpuratum]